MNEEAVGKEQEEFEKAFSEAALDTSSDDETQTEEKGGEPEVKQGDQPADAKGESKEEPKGENDGKEQKGDDDPEVWKQRYKTLEGKYRKEVVEVRKSAEQKEEPKAPAPAPEAKKDDEDKLDDESEALIKELDEDLPTVSKAIRVLLGKERKRLEKEFEAKLQPIAKTAEEVAVKGHFDKIRDAHNDFDDIVNGQDLYDFVDAQPSFIKGAMKDVLAKGSATEVIDLLTTFKKATGKLKSDAGEGESKPQNKTAAELRREKARDDAEDVKVRSVPAIPAGKPDPDDFDAAFNEAISKPRAA